MRSAESRTVPLLEPEEITASTDACGYDTKRKEWTIVLRTNGLHWNGEELCAAVAAVCSHELKTK